MVVWFEDRQTLIQRQTTIVVRETSAMHTALVITCGLILLALMLFVGQKLGVSRHILAYSFVGIWLVVAVVNGAVGVVTAGQPLVSELVIGSGVFGAPLVALALFIRA
jgi:hypothetical protein